MRKNLPVTDVERRYAPDTRLISETDHKGVITYVNDGFCEVAGFSAEQLLGQAHNIIRHPDMPPAVFADFWRTLKAGKPWMGIVKNRCSNGDYYWVNAYVTSKFEGGEHVGYQSVRTQPSRELIERAERVYAQISKGRRILPGAKVGLSVTVPLALAVAVLMGAGIAQLADNWGALATAIAVVAAALGFSGVGVWLTRRLRRVAARARAVFDNKVAASVYGGGQDEAGQLELALEMEYAQQRTLLGRIEDIADQLLVASQSLESATRLARQAVDGQRVELEQVVTAMSEMTATVHQVSVSTANAATAAANAVRESKTGGEVVNHAIDAMAGLAREVEQAVEVINRLQRDGEGIRGVLEVIGGISEQTNLLALNAAIEAARAGDSGRGFAVVADEVRTLAQRSGASAQEIGAMIDSLQAAAAAAVEVMTRSRDAAVQVVEMAEKAGNTIQEMETAVQRIMDMNTEIASAAEEQTATSEEIKRNVECINGNVGESANATLRAKQASEELVAMVDSLRGMLCQFSRAI